MLDVIELAGWSYEPVGDRNSWLAYLVDNTGFAYALPREDFTSPIATAFRFL